MLWGLIACWHRWRSASMRRRSLALLERSEAMALAAHRALLESLAAQSRAGGASIPPAPPPPA